MAKASTEAKKKNGKNQLTPEDWIRAATRVLVDKSIDAVRVEVLAKTLRVTRGSFYWHFRSREDLLTQVLTAWRNEATEQIISRFESKGKGPAELIEDMAALPQRGEAAQRAASVELAIRAWARRDEMARAVVDEVDRKRLAYISACFRELGFDEAQAPCRAFMLYSYVISEALLSNQGDAGQKEARHAFISKLLLERNNAPA